MTNPAGGMGGFFPGMFGDLLKMMKTDSPLPWELTVQLAHNVASEGEGEGNVDPLERIHIEELSRIAELFVADVTGVAAGSAGRPSGTVPVTRVEWANRKLDLWRPLFTELAEAIAPDPSAILPLDAAEDGIQDEDELRSFFQTWATTISPALTAMQLGSIVGHAAATTIGSYDLLLPSEPIKEALIVTANMVEFARDWSLSLDDAELYLIVRELTTEMVLARPHIRSRLYELIVRRAKAFRPNPNALEALIAEASADDASDPSAIMNALGNPTALGELVETDELRQTVAALDAAVAAILGYVDWATDAVAKRCIGARLPIVEAIRRRRLDAGDAVLGAETLFGISTNDTAIGVGHAFVEGVLERGGESELARLVLNETGLPTPAEIGAPGLWIERTHLPST